MRRLVVDTLLRPEPGTRVTGYKEIRWGRPDVVEHVDWLRAVLPGVRFVINTRDHAAVARSGWWAADPDARETLAVLEARLDEIADHLGPSVAHRVRHDQTVAEAQPLRGLVEWLGETYDEAAVRAVLETRHAGRGPGGRPP